ncbi:MULTISPECIES: PH domain-containing protein [unclassified Nocardioides]|uniref:PH domain-containing protein n=1 Tax=unclassified Nocardioides TaxID=2615069 RepID=UPI0006F7D845|nr:MULTISPECIES: PH domain-containing protein [unclassified Nocardioides]KQY54535.1 membrane-flanked domain protein [Nocardioides sp. Root140]KQZ66410.1 membrane-flanked domain protein [Nocardioides sp. Root151]KRF19610.1 membrane-flanked domain protein [Nocardioides sp. Soil796]
MGLTKALTDPNIRKHLLREEGEVIVDEVMHHWIVYTLPVLEVLAAIGLLVVFPFIDLDLAWFPFLLAFVILAHAAWKTLAHFRDRFVITNMRVFRVHGVLSQHLATMPLSRILDITVVKPFQGRIIGYGHFVFESAAQEQGLRDIRFVGQPDQRDLSIQRVVQRSGLRGPKVN